jgi:two-component system chemotaxis sensor kinase CheA
VSEDPYRYFRVEAKELLDELTKGVLELDRGTPAAQVAPGILRHAHTLKGAARVVKQPDIADHAHAIEDALDSFRDSSEVLPKVRLEAVLALLDQISARITELPFPDVVATPNPRQSQLEAPIRTVRAEIGEMDILLEGVGEAHARLGALREELRTIERLRELAALLMSQLSERNETTPIRRPTGDRSKRAHSVARELLSSISTFERSVRSNADHLHRELGEIRDGVERLRLVPASVLFTDLERATRDVAQAQSKRVVFEGRGGELRLDAHLLATAQGALQQIVRNAVAHGIESESERRAMGKSSDGKVSVEIERRGPKVIITCSDDGRGVDLDAVRAAARRKGMLVDDIDSLSPSELTQLLLIGGISTSSAITELSGRGIGLDVVRDFVMQVGGGITVTTDAGIGTTVELEVPLPLAAFDALSVESDGILALIPLDVVVETMRLGWQDVQAQLQGGTLAHNGKVLPFLHLSEVLSEKPATSHLQGGCPIVIMSTSSGILAVGVQRLLGTSNIVVRPLPSIIESLPIISGVWLDAEGIPQLVLDANGLFAKAQHSKGRPSEEMDETPLAPILVIDDSLTTRMLEQSILESADYLVEVASSAEEGLVKAMGKPYALFLVDVEMPGMDGFAFIEQTKSDPTLRHIPAILVTSRSAPEDLQRGFDAGASAYFTKGDFDQSTFLERIQDLTRRE